MARELQYMTSQWNTMLLKVFERLAPVTARVKTLVRDRNVLGIACGPTVLPNLSYGFVHQNDHGY